MDPRPSRRAVLRSAAGAAGAALSLEPLSPFALARGPRPVRAGFVGVGGRGTGLLATMLDIEGVEVPAVCDIEPAHAARASGVLTGAGRAAPELYTAGEYAYEDLMARDDLDAVIIATPWHWHTPMAVCAMKNGKYAGVEVPAAISLEQCWALVDTSEETGVPCMMLENWSFRRDNLALLRMVRAGLFGRIVHCHAAHSHDCIDHWFFTAETGADRWGAEYLLAYNRDQYPTHGLGPVLSWLDVNVGDRFASVTSSATGSFGINAYFARRFGADHPSAKRKYAQGDIVTSTIRTARGKTLVVNYDMQLPRPYDNRWMLQGTLGIYDEERAAVYLTGRSPEYHQWEPFAPYQEEFDHPWWTGGLAAGGHGGVDGLELRLFVAAVRDGAQTPLDVYDSATMSALVALSGLSIERNGAPVEWPDFTRGRWEERRPTFAVVP
ncbi:MAG: Gfo/Idh/MocA family oxidoreductase [Planctomycetota bacterium]